MQTNPFWRAKKPDAKQASGLQFFGRGSCSLQKLRRDLHGHSFVAALAGVQVIAGVVFGQEPVGSLRVPEGFVEVDAAVDQVGGADEFVVRMAHLLAEGGVGTPAAHGQQGTHVHPVAVAAGLGDVFLQAVDQLLDCGQILHGPEGIVPGTHGMDDVVDALLDDDSVGPVCGDLVVEPMLAGKAVALVGQAGVFPQNSRAGGGPPDDGSVVKALPEAPQGQVVRPVLGGDGVAVADHGPVFRRGQHGHVAQEVIQVGGPGSLQRDVGRLRLVAVGVQALAQGAAGVDHAAHEGEIPQIEADLDHLAGGDRQLQRVRNGSLACADGDGLLRVKADRVEFAPVEDGGLRQRDGLGAAVIVKGQPDGGSGKGNVDGVADGDVFGVPLGPVLGHGDGVAPYAGPVLIGHDRSTPQKVYDSSSSLPLCSDIVNLCACRVGS